MDMIKIMMESLIKTEVWFEVLIYKEKEKLCLMI
ncbi:hypothetical protein ELI_2634 [Eubacterium callanderi]|uniref:Uncharacterized protein n=1 Tax=Eubacterium callanderi TaxID=53442 RepID=E3GP11_9FIRM|nr:hypothetical protein ELI_2634 [Eubacterium callanderi]